LWPEDEQQQILRGQKAKQKGTVSATHDQEAKTAQRQEKSVVHTQQPQRRLKIPGFQIIAIHARRFAPPQEPLQLLQFELYPRSRMLENETHSFPQPELLGLTGSQGMPHAPAGLLLHIPDLISQVAANSPHRAKTPSGVWIIGEIKILSPV